MILTQSQKMVKHTHTIRRQQPSNCLRVFDHFVGLAHQGLKGKLKGWSSISQITHIFQIAHISIDSIRAVSLQKLY